MSHKHLSLTFPGKKSAGSISHGFHGVFTKELREEFRALRQSLGVSLQQLGEFFQISWSTVRKWEAGISPSCHARHTSRVSNFLNHQYDQQLRALNEPDNSVGQLMKRAPKPLLPYLERAWTTYGVTQCYPGESVTMVRLLQSLVNRFARELLMRCLGIVEAPSAMMGEDSDENRDQE